MLRTTILTACVAIICVGCVRDQPADPETTDTPATGAAVEQTNTGTPAVETPDTSNSGQVNNPDPLTDIVTETVTETNSDTEPDVVAVETHPGPVIDLAGTTLFGDFVSGDTLTLDGSQSKSENRSIVSYQWEQIANGSPSVELDNDQSAVATFAASQDISGIPLNFQFSVTDSEGATAQTNLSFSWNIGKTAEELAVPPTAAISSAATVAEGSTITLDGSGSSGLSATIVSYLWEQTGGPTNLDIQPADQSIATATAPLVDVETTYQFDLTVTDTFGNQGTDSIAVIVQPIFITLVNNGSYTTGTTGDFYAETATSIYIADQDNMQIRHVNGVTNEDLSTFALTGSPTKLDYVSATNSLYTALDELAVLTRINLATGTQTAIDISGPALYLATKADRIYYTVDDGSSDYGLFSIGDDNEPFDHGIVEGNMIHLNPVTDEIVAVQSGHSPSTVYRYTLTATSAAVLLESSRDLGSNAQDLTISADGTRLAISAGSGNGSSPFYTVFDVDAADLTVSNGQWDTGSYPKSVDFSTAGDFLVTSNSTDIQVFDASVYALPEVHIPPDCVIFYDNLIRVRVSSDDNYVFGKLTCGFDRQETHLVFHKLR